MTLETFKKCIERALELDITPKIHSAGQGEPTLNPLLPEFADHVHSLGLEYGITTNGHLLSEELAGRLLDANLSHIVFSISDLDEDYESVYALKYDITRENVLRFLDMNEAAGKPTRTTVSIVEHANNSAKLDGYRKFWKETGVDEILNYTRRNRGGACDNGRHFANSNRYIEDAMHVLKENSLSHVCKIPFLFLYMGWDGQYNMCSNDYRKLTTLGSIFDYSIVEMDLIKKEKSFEFGGPEACRKCDVYPANSVREALFKIEFGQATIKKLDRIVATLHQAQNAAPDYVRLLTIP
jgi:MoaA/NifB/PqqE/SkfB family radical SAM enzyme